MTEPGLFDRGLQPERTDLAWRRTTLAMAVGALIALRLLPPVLGQAGLAIGLGGLLIAAILWMLARRRAQRTQQSLRQQSATPGGALLLALASLAASGSAVGLLYVAVNQFH